MKTITAIRLAHALLDGHIEASNDIIVKLHGELAEEEDTVDLAQSLYDQFKFVVDNYDDHGNWVGAVANENGWTA